VTTSRIAAWPGAWGDDYLIKPFAFVELLARTSTLLRPGLRVRWSKSHWRIWEIDVVRRRVIRAGQRVDLTRGEFSLLQLLSNRKAKSQ